MFNRDCAAKATGGWWYNGCDHVHLTGQHTKSRTRLEDDKQITYFDSARGEGKEEEGWMEAEMLLVLKPHVFVPWP